MNLINGLIGIFLLALGWRLFWLFIGCVGFTAGLQMGYQYFGLQPIWMAWAIALLFGLTGALLGVFFQSLAIIPGGFAAGSTIAAYITFLTGLPNTPVITVSGGILGAIVPYSLFDWALIGLSSFVGATLVVQALNWNSQTEIILYVLLITAGIVVQTALWRQKNRNTK